MPSSPPKGSTASSAGGGLRQPTLHRYLPPPTSSFSPSPALFPSHTNASARGSFTRTAHHSTPPSSPSAVLLHHQQQQQSAVAVVSASLPPSSSSAVAPGDGPSDSEVGELWERYCGPLVGTLAYSDAVVDDMWTLFYPLLTRTPLLPLARSKRATTTTMMMTGSGAGSADSLTHCLVVDLHAMAVAQRCRESATVMRSTTTTTTTATKHGQPSSNAMGSASKKQRSQDSGGNETVPSEGGREEEEPAWADMRAVLHEQPHIIIPLLEFFAAVMERQRRLRQIAAPNSASTADSRAPAAQALLLGEDSQPAVWPTTTTSSSSSLTKSAALSLSDPLGKICCIVLGDAAQPMPFDRLGAALLGRLITVKGTVVRLSPSRITAIRLPYRCGLCGQVKEMAAEDGVLVYPGPCAGRCRGYKWFPLTDQAVCEEVQVLKLQEHTDFFDASPSSSSLSSSSPSSMTRSAGAGHGGGEPAAGGGGVNRVIEVELRVPLLDRVSVGDAVCVCGVLGTRRGERKAGATQQICLRARSVVSATAASGRAESGRNGSSLMSLLASSSAASADLVAAAAAAAAASAGARVLLNDEHTQQQQQLGSGGHGQADEAWSAEESGRFYEMTRQPRWFERLAASVAPSLYGLEMVKEAVLLAVVGGSTHKLGTRSSIHLLMLGDPGLGKSQLLRAACAIAPRSAFVCAHTSSSCGLTMTLSRDPVSGETAFEAGAVVHGDGGVTCIDEIDKGASEHKALLEVMEQETVSMAKAGMVFSMPVHTSLLAAGNPLGGRFDLTKPIAANVNLSPALLSRFDIIVCLRDPHTSSTVNLTRHVLQMHRYRSQQAQSTPSAVSGLGGSLSMSAGPGHLAGGAGASGKEENHVAGGVLPTALVQRFISFCRSQCQPTLREEACAVLKQHYLEERAKSCAATTTTAGASTAAPMELAVTPRYLQALIRVAEARAKVELRHEVTQEDAVYAVQLLQGCLDTFAATDDAGGSSGSGGGGRTAAMGIGSVSRKKTQREVVIDLLKAEVVRNGTAGNRLSHNVIIAACEEAGCKNPAAMLHQLNEFGVLLQCGDKYTLRGV